MKYYFVYKRDTKEGPYMTFPSSNFQDPFSNDKTFRQITYKKKDDQVDGSFNDISDVIRQFHVIQRDPFSRLLNGYQIVFY